MAQETSALLDHARSLIEYSKPRELVKHVSDLAGKNDAWRSMQCINLNAAESVPSPSVQAILRCDLSHRAFLGEIGNRRDKGAKYLDEIEAMTIELAKKLFDVDYAEYRPVTGSVADGIAMRCLTEVGDTVLALEEPRGHPSWREIGYAGYRGINVVDIPFDYEKFNIDVDGLTRIIEENRKAKLVVVGSSLFLFPYPLREIHRITSEIGAKLWYDGAHVLGLIAGKMFQDPLREGADLLTGSTQKTLSGPLGALMLHGEEGLDEKIRYFFYGHLSSIGHNRTAALAVALAEMLEFGKDFAEQIVRNAKALASALDKEGFDVVGKGNGYTESHMVASDVKKLGGGQRVATRLEQCNIICSAFKLWTRDEPYHGIRLGVTEMTRYGMKEPEMKSIAELIRRAVIDQNDMIDVCKKVLQLRNEFMQLHYCFENHEKPSVVE